MAGKDFRFYSTKKLISFQNDVSLTTIRLGVLWWESHTIVSLDQLGGSKSNYWSFRHVYRLDESKKLQKFINFCLKVGHNANLKHLVHMKNIIVLWKVQNHYNKSSGHNARSALLDRGTGTINLRLLIAERERSIYDSCRAFYRAFSCEPTNYESVQSWVTHLHIAMPTINRSLTRDPRVKRMFVILKNYFIEQ